MLYFENIALYFRFITNKIGLLDYIEHGKDCKRTCLSENFFHLIFKYATVQLRLGLVGTSFR